MTEAAQPNLFTRDDTFFGICEALGQDFGIHANWLRLAIAGVFFFAPVQVIIGYLAAGVVVLASRWLFPAPVAPVAIESDQAQADETASQPVRVPVSANVDPELLPLAA